ncbi:hypothetical protein HanXRQr2_Chr16g0765921 [Helianthus annuus]|uniref:Uncharacterized protein n=1 Tax=Helianthus annuus TaxID=4232 RepID=A0A9K3DV05_HELAN|nr:hypothetical protein HanXRQr2_Chr16g0765921 [Helianthus annuus]KAJ0439353.1 hypothetical protein HanHA300_Chr16g0624371 [Helianthus annuus]KAJ0461702.1 hypothetical protein HanHA89_Chr16g0675281 [Helianthus annuus]KAJ0822610.1 hypothetical protein HanPSC8_Chr16g0734081 [Helianthus annuus]
MYHDMVHFRTDFAVLFLTTMVTSQQNGYVKDKVLKCLTAETRFEDYNWCGFIVDCLRKCKKKWIPWDLKSWSAGPLTILTVHMCFYRGCMKMKKKKCAMRKKNQKLAVVFFKRSARDSQPRTLGMGSSLSTFGPGKC